MRRAPWGGEKRLARTTRLSEAAAVVAEEEPEELVLVVPASPG